MRDLSQEMENYFHLFKFYLFYYRTNKEKHWRNKKGICHSISVHIGFLVGWEPEEGPEGFYGSCYWFLRPYWLKLLLKALLEIQWAFKLAFVDQSKRQLWSEMKNPRWRLKNRNGLLSPVIWSRLCLMKRKMVIKPPIHKPTTSVPPSSHLLIS